ncbi:MAG: DUF4232 domain-containing protein [Bifidobacterium sp.]|uniref:DUF4232 domain-containing protein n=1 Tax=Bifidobacterium sp. TaxID=41200 RepID=UPI003F0F3C18
MAEEFARFAEEGHIMIGSQHGNGSNSSSSGTGSSRRSGVHSPARAWAAIALSVAVMAGSLCACGSTSGTDASPSVSASSPAASQSSSTASASSPSVSASASASAVATGACTTKELTAKLTQGAGGGAGSSYPYLVLTNSGTQTCTLRGYPGVSLRHGNTQIGAAAKRDSTVTASTITLKPGQSAHSALRIVNAGNFDAADCTPTAADTMLIYPPDQTDAISIDATGLTGCADENTQILYVQVFQPGEE